MLAFKLFVVSGIAFWVFRGMARNLARHGLEPKLTLLLGLLSGIVAIGAGLAAGYQWIVS